MLISIQKEAEKSSNGDLSSRKNHLFK